PFQNLRENQRYASAWIASRPALDSMLKRHSGYFGGLGITERSTAGELLLRIEGSKQRDERWRGFGLAFGYPDFAVDFFVNAGMHYAETGEFVERDFRHYPTHSRAKGGFVYAVPKLQRESDSEITMLRKVEAILTVYRGLRTKYIHDDDPKRVLELIRDWFDDGSGWCHPDHAMQKALAWETAREWIETKGTPLSTAVPTEPLDDLSALDATLQQPRIIALGESTHGTREFFQLKHRLFRHLVEKHGVRLFGIEASYAACLPINDYVQSGVGDPRAAIKGQGFWTWDTEEVFELVEWMREWNENRKPGDSPIQFYGFDTQDAYTPLRTALGMLEGVMETKPFRERLAIALQKQYGGALDSANKNQLDGLLDAIEQLQRQVDLIDQVSAADRGEIRLLLRQAYAAIRIDRTRMERWSSLGMLKEIELYDRIRIGLPKLSSAISASSGEPSRALQELIREASDLQRCQLRYRDELNDQQRRAWHDAVRRGVTEFETKEVQAVLVDLQKFLEVSDEYLNKPKELTNVRDETMAEFVTSIIDQHGEDARIALWAHDWHVSKFKGMPTEDVPRMGTFLEQAYRDDYLPIGLSFGSGEFQAKYYPQEDEDPARLTLRAFNVEGARNDSFSHLFDFHESPLSAFVFGDDPAEGVPPWFRRPHPNRTIGAVFQPKLEDSDSYYEDVVLSEHFEIVLHIKKTSRARPLSPVPRFRFGAKLVDAAVTDNEASLGSESSTVMVESVSENSLAERCGLKVGDRIVRVEGEVVGDVKDFEKALAKIVQPGSKEVEILRDSTDHDQDAAPRRLLLYLLVPPWITE
ncbi:MAG: erythromycin esterase family protein, partial [Planctomycetota bacterium]